MTLAEAHAVTVQGSGHRAVVFGHGRSTAFHNAAGRGDGVVTSLRVIDEVVAAERELERRARYDELTGLVNRSEAIQRLGAVLSHPRRRGSEIALAFCDLDRFKAVNDTYGHAAGDQVLRHVARCLAGAVRSDDVVTRMGGDEFLVALIGVHDLADAAGIAETMRCRIAQPSISDFGEVAVTASIGITIAAEGESLDDVAARADTAMFQAKRQGRDQVVPIDAG